MKRLLSMLAVALSGLLPTCVPAHAQPVSAGEPVQFFAVCAHRETAETLAGLMVLTSNYNDAQAALIEKVKEGECVVLPQWMERAADELGTDRPNFVDEDGDLMEARAVRVGSAWTVSLRVVKPKQS